MMVYHIKWTSAASATCCGLQPCKHHKACVAVAHTSNIHNVTMRLHCETL